MRFPSLIAAVLGAALIAPASAGAATAPTAVSFTTTHRGYAVVVTVAEAGPATRRVLFTVTARKRVPGGVAEHRYQWYAPDNSLRLDARAATVAIDGIRLSLSAASGPSLRLPPADGCTGYAGLYRPARAHGSMHLTLPDLGTINATDPRDARILPVGPGRQRCPGPGTCARPAARGRIEVDLSRIVDGETRTLNVVRGRPGRPFQYVFTASRRGRGSVPDAWHTLTLKARRGPAVKVRGKRPSRMVLRAPGHGITGSFRLRGTPRVSEELYPCRHLHVRWFEGLISGGLTARIPDLAPRALRAPAHGSYRIVTR